MITAPVLADAAAISAGDTAWVLASTALVMVMTVGLAFFYGGLVRPKKRAQHDDDERRCAGADQRAVGAVRLLHRIRARHTVLGRARLAGLQGRGPRPR